jgi:rod shape-determining protein MreD
MNKTIKYITLFTGLLLLQILLFNNIQFSGYVNPYVYVMFIIMLPLGMPEWLVLLLSFLTGFTVDMFCGTLGVHTAASVMAGFARPYLLSLNITSEAISPSSTPSIKNNGIRWFIVFTFSVVLVHHLTLFYVEVFRFSGFFRTLLRALLSTAFTTFFIVVMELFRSRR